MRSLFSEACSPRHPRFKASLQHGAQVIYAFDSLGYAKRLRECGLSQDRAEVHAEAARDFIIVTRADLLATKQELPTAMENLGLRLTIRLGAMLVVAIGAVATILKLA